MKLFGCSNAIRLLSVLSFFSISSGAVLEQRASGDSVVCGKLEQKCTPKDGPSYCCPKENMCGSVNGQCIKIPKSVASKSATTVKKSSTATSAAATVQVQSIPSTSQIISFTTSSAIQPSSTAAASSKETGALEAVKNFFKPNIIIIFAVSGAGAILAITLISCFCYRKRKQGRLLLAAYENPNRDLYKSVIITGDKPAPSSDTTRGATDTTKEAESPLSLPPSAKPAPQVQPERSPQPQYFDLYSPESSAFQMTAQTPAGPLEHSSGGGGDASGYYFPQEQQQQYQQPQQQYQPYQQYQQPQPQQYQQPQQRQTHYPDMRHHDVNYNGYGAGIENHYGSSPGDSYAAGDIYSAYAAPHPAEEIYTYPVQEYPPRQYIPPEPASSSWSSQHYRQLTPSHQAHTTQQESPPRPQRGPDVYLPVALREHHGMSRAI